MLAPAADRRIKSAMEKVNPGSGPESAWDHPSPARSLQRLPGDARVVTFIQSVLIAAPAEAVFRFHERDDALDLLAPAFPPLRMISRTGGIKTGARVEMRVGVFSWVALHTGYEKNRLFVDEQIRGPFAKWVHRHEFERVDGGTRLTDRIEYELPGGSLVNILFGWLVRIGLRNLFAHRHRVTKEVCEKASSV